MIKVIITRRYFLMLLLLFFSFSLLILSPILSARAAAQAPPLEWERFFNGYPGYSVLQTEDGGFAVTGVNGSSSLLIKTDSQGNLVWAKSYALEGTDTNLPFVAQTKDGGYALGGTLGNKYAMVKVDAQGNMQWNRSYAYDAPFNSFRCFTQTSDGGFVFIGAFSPPQNASHAIAHMWLVKTDSIGSIQWNRTIIGPQGDFANTIIQSSDEGFLIFGTSWASDYVSSSFKLIKTDSNGNEMWNKTYGGTGKFFTAESDAGIVTKDGGYLLAGVSVENDSNWLAWLVKTDDQGNMVWNQNYGGIGSWALAVVQTQDEGYAFAGLHNGKDVWLVKTDANGAAEWNETFAGAQIWGTTIEDFGTCLIQTNDGGLVLAGSKNSQIWLAKLTTSIPATIGLSVEIELIAVLAIALIIGAVVVLLRRLVRLGKQKEPKNNSIKA